MNSNSIEHQLQMGLADFMIALGEPLLEKNDTGSWRHEPRRITHQGVTPLAHLQISKLVHFPLSDQDRPVFSEKVFFYYRNN